MEVEDPTAVQEEMAREHYRKLRRNTIGAWVLSIPLALLGMVFMHTPGGNWIMMALALVIMIVFGRSFYVNGVGMEPRLVGAIASAEKGALSAPVKGLSSIPYIRSSGMRKDWSRMFIMRHPA